MSTGAIIAIVVVVVLIVLLVGFVFSPKARTMRRERELGQRRDEAIETQREQASVRNERAQAAQSQADIAAAEAERARAAAHREQAEAQLHEARASRHEQGIADHELIDDNERDRFAGTSAVQEPVDGDAVGGREERHAEVREERPVEADDPGARRSERLE